MATYHNPLNTRLSDSQKNDNAAFIYEYLSSKGWTMQAVAALLGNFESECGLNPNVFEGYYIHSSDLGKYGYGLAQWTPWLGTSTYNTPAKQRNYHGSNNPTFGRWCLDNGRDKRLMETQLDYVHTGLGGYIKTSNYNLTYAQFRVSTRGADWLSKLYYVNYERSAAGTWGPRPSQALAWFEYLRNLYTPGVPAPEPDPGTPEPDPLPGTPEPEPDPEVTPEEPKEYLHSTPSNVLKMILWKGRPTIRVVR